MARIVTYARRFKRPPKKKRSKAAALLGQAVVTTERSRRPTIGVCNDPGRQVGKVLGSASV
jgi:hypothetical protein